MSIAGRIMLIPRGPYDPAAVYNVLDIVRYENKPWICKKSNIVGVTPSEEHSDIWMLFIDISISNADTLDGHDSSYFAPAKHEHAASEVGARPSDWMPTASEVGAAETEHEHSADAITSGVFEPSRGGTGKTTLKDALNAMINSLSVGNTTPKDEDYYVCQKAGGGTSEPLYYRRPISYLWNYIKAKADLVYATLEHVHTASDITSGYLSVPRGGTGVVSITEGNALIGNGTGSIKSRAITNLTAKGVVTANTNLVTANTVVHNTNARLNRTSTINVADTNYTTYMARGIALVTAVPDSMVNGAVAFVYE